jgi:hypothetical protein
MDYEFRCYVHRNTLTAISQYDHYCRHEHLFPRKQEFERRIRELWQVIHPLVGAASYGMDFAYVATATEAPSRYDFFFATFSFCPT